MENSKFLIAVFCLMVFAMAYPASAKTYPSDYPAGLGIYDAGTIESLQDENNTEITWHVMVRGVSLPDSHSSKNTGIEDGGRRFYNTHIDDGTPDDMLSQISKARSSSFTNYYDYGMYFLAEEMMSPAFRTTWGATQTKMINYHIGDKTTLMGIEIKQIKVWCEENKGIEWDVGGGAPCTRDWWTTISNANTYTDSTYVEWSNYWAHATYSAWHLYMRSLGKKSMIMGISGIGSENIAYDLKNTYYKSPTWEYIFANYDAITMYRYAKKIGPSIWGSNRQIGTAESSRDVWHIRNTFNYSGKLIWIMTQCWSDGAGCPFDDNKSYDEFRRVYTDVDAVIGKPYMDGNTKPTVPYLLKYKHRSIVSWGNTKTGDHIRNFSVNTNEAVTFNASKHPDNSESSVVAWRWYKDGVQVGTNSNTYTASWTSPGAKIIEVNAILSSGHITNTMYWDVTVNNPTTCTPNWQCEQPLNGYESDGCGNRGLNSACNLPPTNQISLKPGWNQISSPIAAGINLAAIESSCTILPYRNQKLWAWNATAQVWMNPAKVEPFRGYWIYAAYQCTVPLSGTSATFSSLQLYNGWNKISASGTFSAIQGTCTGHITGNWVWHWDKATEKWIHPISMQLDKGYWIKVDQNCVLGVA